MLAFILLQNDSLSVPSFLYIVKKIIQKIFFQKFLFLKKHIKPLSLIRVIKILFTNYVNHDFIGCV